MRENVEYWLCHLVDWAYGLVIALPGTNTPTLTSSPLRPLFILTLHPASSPLSLDRLLSPTTLPSPHQFVHNLTPPFHLPSSPSLYSNHSLPLLLPPLPPLLLPPRSSLSLHVKQTLDPSPGHS